METIGQAWYNADKHSLLFVYVQRDDDNDFGRYKTKIK